MPFQARRLAAFGDLVDDDCPGPFGVGFSAGHGFFRVWRSFQDEGNGVAALVFQCSLDVAGIRIDGAT